MPGLKQLEQFRKELSDLGDEREITAGWGEVYEDLPLPDVNAPVASELDVDNLLSSLGGESPSAATGSEFDDLLANLPLGPSDATPSKPVPPVPPKPRAPVMPATPAGAPRSKAPPRQAEPEPEPLEPIEPVESPEMPDFGNLGDLGNFAMSPETTEAPVADELSADSFALPEDLLSGFASDIETARSAGPEEIPSLDEIPALDEIPVLDETVGSAAESPESAFSMPDLDLGTLDMPELAEPAGEEKSSAEAEELESFDLTPVDIEEPPAQASGAPAASEIEEIPEIPELAEMAEPLEPFEAPSAFEMPEFPEAAEAPEAPVADFSIPEMGAMDFTPSFEEGAASASEIEIPSFDAGDAVLGAGFAEEKPASAASGKFGEEFADFSIPADLTVAESGEGAGEAAPAPDGFDGFSLDEDILKTSIDSAGSDEDFHIPGFSDFTSTPARAALSEFPAGGAGGAKRIQKKEIPLEISEADFGKFLAELSTFPLNLRIACEEFIAGDSGTEAQKMGLVHDILTKTPVRKVAKTVEGYLSRLIPIPKDFEKKSMEEFEQEKSSLKYVFLNKIAPAAVLFSIIAVLSACVVFLSYEFIYRPLAAESLYRRGYSAIQDTRYTQAMELFNTAVGIWDKKPWYFKYARAFRDQKQYIAAESMYERILAHFRNDKRGGLEYADMLRTDLRNFEKAETVLRRRVLDNYVNDPDGLLQLGDTFLDWGDEDFPTPEEKTAKYEEGRKCYATLINLYGSGDLYLARMMRYFIRTDNLKETLQLKEHFVGKKAKIGADDLVELSGYLLQKRYEPAPGDNEYLRGRIEDVRMFLERAVKADPSVPEAHYNLGRFFIYNYKPQNAKAALSEALRRFDEARTMSPKRVLAHVDAYRLRGELDSENMEYLKARDLYAKGITLYEEQRLNRTVKQSPRVGKLYADIADIDYFISGDLDSALMNYTKATDELGDTPSVRYRLGYIRFQKEDYETAMHEFLRSSLALPDDRNVQYSLGNTLFRRGDWFAAQGYYEKLMTSLDAERVRKGVVLPQIRAEQAAFVETYMRASNNLAVALERVSGRTGNSQKRARAIALLSESNRAWDGLTRNPNTLVRASGSNLAFLNIQNMMQPRSAFVPEIYQDLPRTLEGEPVLRQEIDQ
jgi:tetratricopeptide (TPR) repeat protein